jgi:hypothetical protein
MAKNKTTKKRWDDEENEVESNFISFGQEGDYIYGALLAPRREVPNKLSDKGATQFLYEVKVHDCEYHKLDKKKKVIDEPVEPEEGETIIIGGKAGFDHKLARLKVGQLFGIKFVEELEPKISGHNPTKVFKVFLPKDNDGEFMMDDEVLEGAKADKKGNDWDDFKSNKDEDEDDDDEDEDDDD